MEERHFWKTLLAIDDDPTLLRLLKLLFAHDFSEILVSEDPHEGLRLAITYKPALILVDNEMPGMLGVEFLAQVKNMPATRDIPVILLTGDNQQETVLNARQHHADAYLLKPCQPQDLREIVFKTLTKNMTKTHFGE